MPHRFRIQIMVVLLLLASLAFTQRSDGLLRVFFLETAGDAALIQTPSGQHILVDGGADPVALASALGRLLPFWKHHLDATILTLQDGQHTPGQVAALTRYKANAAFAAPLKSRSPIMQQWARLLTEANTPLSTLHSGTRFQIDAVEFEILDAGDGDGGIVIAMKYGATRMVLAHSASPAAETRLAATGTLRRANLVAYPWERDPNNVFIEALAPQAIVFTDGVSEDRPAELTIPQRAVGGAALYHERLHGTVEWRSDGRHTMVSAERRYCANSSTWSERLLASLHSVSASCSNRERS